MYYLQAMAFIKGYLHDEHQFSYQQVLLVAPIFLFSPVCKCRCKYIPHSSSCLLSGKWCLKPAVVCKVCILEKLSAIIMKLIVHFAFSKWTPLTVRHEMKVKNYKVSPCSWNKIHMQHKNDQTLRILSKKKGWQVWFCTWMENNSYCIRLI